MESFELYLGSGGKGAPLICAVDMLEHPFDFAAIAGGIDELQANIVAFSVGDWDRSLTPWKAPSLYREQPDFGGGAQETLNQLLTQWLPKAEGQCGLYPQKKA